MTRRILAVIRTAIIAPLFVSIWTWFVPRWFGGVRAFEQPRVWGWAVVAPGVLLLVACAWNFAWRGLGTPAPFDPPRRLVVSGPYAHVRNPMYLGLLLTLVGEAVVFPRIAAGLLIEAALFWIGATLFVVAAEEPMLRGAFDGGYEQYARNVRRWIPRLAPWYAPAHLE